LGFAKHGGWICQSRRQSTVTSRANTCELPSSCHRATVQRSCIGIWVRHYVGIESHIHKRCSITAPRPRTEVVLTYDTTSANKTNSHVWEESAHTQRINANVTNATTVPISCCGTPFMATPVKPASFSPQVASVAEQRSVSCAT